MPFSPNEMQIEAKSFISKGPLLKGYRSKRGKEETGALVRLKCHQLKTLSELESKVEELNMMMSIFVLRNGKENEEIILKVKK